MKQLINPPKPEDNTITLKEFISCGLYKDSYIVLLKLNDSKKVILLQRDTLTGVYSFKDKYNNIITYNGSLNSLFENALNAGGNIFIFENWREFAEFVIKNNLE